MEPAHEAATPFRFYDNRQKYLAFINTCNEKQVIAAKAAAEIVKVRPRPPALRIFDAGMGDATVLSRLLRTVHREFPTVPLLVVGKEISLEDVRLALDKLPDRFHEHPHTVIAITNLKYADAPHAAAGRSRRGGAARLARGARSRAPRRPSTASRSRRSLPILAEGWRTRPSPGTGNPIDRAALGARALPRGPRVPARRGDPPARERARREYDFILASQPWRASMPATFKAEKILAPLARSLAPHGRLLTIQSWGRDPGLEVVQRLWPDENPFQVDRHALLDALRAELGDEAGDFDLTAPADHEAVFRYRMHTLPSEIGDRIGTSTLFAAWNAVIYVNQIEDERLEQVMRDGSYLEATQEVLQRARRPLVQRRGLRRHAERDLRRLADGGRERGEHGLVLGLVRDLGDDLRVGHGAGGVEHEDGARQQLRSPRPARPSSSRTNGSSSPRASASSRRPRRRTSAPARRAGRG